MTDNAALTRAEQWLRACSAWLLTNDLDMEMPGGILDTDPLDIADDLAALDAQAGRAGVLPYDVRRLVIAARVVAFENQGRDALRELDQASEAFADRVPWDDEPETSDEPA